jgi:thioredoxin 1
MKQIIELTEDNFETEIANSKELVLVDFAADWCGPCKMQEPVLTEIAIEQSGRVKVGKVDIDRNAALAERFAIQSIPTLLYFADSRLRHKSVGVASKKAILEKLSELTDAA